MQLNMKHIQYMLHVPMYTHSYHDCRSLYYKFEHFREGFNFVKITPSQNGEITLSFPDVGKSCPSRQLFYVAYLSLNAIRENKILAKSSELRDCEHISYVSILAVSQNQPILNLFHAHARTQNVLPEGVQL